MSFFSRRSSSVPPAKTRLSRSQSFSVPNSTARRHDALATAASDASQRSSFHGSTEHSKVADDQTIDSLNETIVSLKSSLVSHATSSAEAMNNLNTLQAAHDALYAQHVTLQEQMDDAVELLKYLKEEKAAHEEQIDALTSELRECREKNATSVVSMTIENLTKEKMELEQQLHEWKCRAASPEDLKERNRLLQEKVDGLEKIQEAYELQTRQTLGSGEKLMALEREKDALMAKVSDLEIQSAELQEKLSASDAEQWAQELAACNQKNTVQDQEIVALMRDLGRLQSEASASSDRLNLKDREIAMLKSELENLERELSKKNERVDRYESEIDALKTQLESLDGQSSCILDTQLNHQQKLEIERLANVVEELERELAVKTGELASIDQELVREKAEMQSHLDNLQRQLIHYQEEDDNHSSSQQQQQQHPSQSSMENPSQSLQNSNLALENEQLQYQIQQLESQLQNERIKSEHEAEVHAQLEREMQDRLAQRLAAHLKDSEISMEARIRQELEEEYEVMQQQQHQLNQQRQLRSKSFTTSEKNEGGDSSSSTAFQRELEEQLRHQLQQVKEERERWQSEQEEFQNRVLLSKQQLDKIREGYRAKYDKEKRRANDLQKASEDYQVVIDALHQELHSTKEELEELQMQQSGQTAAVAGTSSGTTSKISYPEWEHERKQFIEREKEYQDELKDLQAELEDLQDIELDCQRLEEEKDGLVKKCKDIFEEHQATLQEMEQLNSENEEFLKKIDTLESAMINLKDSNTKSSELCNELEGQLRNLKQLYDEAVETNKEASKQSADKLEIVSRELEIEKKKWLDERAVYDAAKEEADNKCRSFAAERDRLLQQLEAKGEKLLKLESEVKNQTDSVQQLTAKLEAMEQKQSDLIEAMSLKDGERESLEAELKDANSTVTKLRNELAAALAEKQDILSSKSEEINARESLVSKIVLLTDSAEKLKEERTELETSLRELQRSSTERIQSLEKEKAVLHSSLNLAEEGTKEVNKLQDELSALRFSLEEANKANEALLTAHESEKQSFEERLEALQNEVNKLTEAKSALQIHIETLESQVDAADSNKDRFDELDQENNNLKEELNKLRSSLETAHNTNESATAQLEEKLASLQAANSTFQTENQALGERLAASTLNADKLVALEEENAAIKQEIESLEASLEDSKGTNEQLTSLQAQIEELKVSNSSLNTENETLNARVSAISNTDAKLEALEEENRNLKSELEKLCSSLEAATEANEISVSDRVTDKNEYEERIGVLRAENDKLKEVMSAGAAAAASTDEITKELAETKAALKLLQTKFDDVQDTNVTLEEAIQDIQLEKEDIEAENEELATKLGDLTVQAKAMLTRNEEMEAQIAALKSSSEEYEDRQSKLEDNTDLVSLREKYDDALEIIQQLKNEERHCPNEDDSSIRRLEEENLELKEVVDHLTNENQAAMEIKLIAMELKTKNASLQGEVNRLNETNERLLKRMENDSCENRVIPYQENVLQTAENSYNSNTAELEHYKTIVDQLMSDRAVFTQRLGELMNINQHIGSAKEMTTAIESLRGNTMIYASPDSRALVTTDSQPEELDDQLRNLTIENGELAQRLGGAVAEKEFALSTLSRLGAKLEELHERNKMLESIANLKSSRAVEASRRSSFDSSSFMSSYRVMGDKESKPPLRDPTGYGELRNCESKPSLFEDQSTTDYSLGSYLPQKPLEPEESDDMAGSKLASRNNSQETAQDPTPQSGESGMKLIKLPGGEYYGEVNENGQKHGRGKMIYDNGNKYEGTWVANKRDGNGTTKYASGNMYVGAWKEGKRHGFGVFHIKKTGDVYRGNWSRGLKHGAGVYEYADGELDVSVYQEDIRVGEGVRWSASRDRASKLIDGILVGDEGDMSLQEAEQLTKRLGFII